MATFLVERYLPGLAVDDLAEIAARAAAATVELAATGVAICYLDSTLVPGDEACLCCFEAESAAAVAAANERAGVPFARVVEARRITRPDWRQPRRKQ